MHTVIWNNNLIYVIILQYLINLIYNNIQRDVKQIVTLDIKGNVSIKYESKKELIVKSGKHESQIKIEQKYYS